MEATAISAMTRAARDLERRARHIEDSDRLNVLEDMLMCHRDAWCGSARGPDAASGSLVGLERLRAARVQAAPLRRSRGRWRARHSASRRGDHRSALAAALPGPRDRRASPRRSVPPARRRRLPAGALPALEAVFPG